MPPAIHADVPDCARWFLASENSAVLVWAETGTILALNAKGRALLDGIGQPWTVDATSVRDVFLLAGDIDGDQLARALGSDGPARA